MTANNKKCYLNELVDEYNNSYRHSTGTKPVDTDYSTLTEKDETNSKSPKFKVGGSVRIKKYKIILSKSYTENCSKETWWLILC